MKKLLAVAALAAVLISCNNKADTDMFTLSGQIKSAPDQKVYLEQVFFNPTRSAEVLDTGELKNGKFQVSAIAPEEGLYRIRLADGAGDIFINETTEISFNGTALMQEPLNGSFSGQANMALKKLIQYADSMGFLIANKNRLLTEFTKASVKSDDSIFIATFNEFTALKASFTKFGFAYADTAKNPVLALFAATMAPVEVKEFEAPLTRLAGRFPKHMGIAEALAYVKSPPPVAQTQTLPASAPAIGTIAPELTMNDVDGKPFSLTRLRGKYVLIDFWASWCGPCREENPNVVAAYNQFKDKNFTVLGVSLDENKQAWVNAVKEDKLNWQHISDLKRWSSTAVPLYGIDGIPYNVLIDPQGKIIATDLRESALQNKLAEVLK